MFGFKVASVVTALLFDYDMPDDTTFSSINVTLNGADCMTFYYESSWDYLHLQYVP